MILTLGLLYILILVLKSALALQYANTYPTPTHNVNVKDVTICQAILSGDPQLENMLSENLQSLPGVRFLWLIDGDDLEAKLVTSKLMDSHSQKQIAVIEFSKPPDGVNPKVFKLNGAQKYIETPYLVILDDDTILNLLGLNALINSLDHSQLSTGLPFYRNAANCYSNLLGQFVNNNSSQTYLSLLKLTAPVSINGMCYALRLETLNDIHGFEPILRHLTDDLAMADQIIKSGGTIHQTSLPLELTTTIKTFPEYARQMHRWFLFAILLMRRQSLGINLMITILHGVPPLLLITMLFLPLICISTKSIFIVCFIFIVRAVVLCLVQIRISGKLRHNPLLSIVSELFQPFHLCHALCSKTIRWRSRRYFVFDNDRFESR